MFKEDFKTILQKSYTFEEMYEIENDIFRNAPEGKFEGKLTVIVMYSQ